MTKFIKSKESISSSLLLWEECPTQISIKDTYNLKVWPITNIFNDGPINFVVPPQPKGMLTDINIVTKFKIQYNWQDIKEHQKNLSVINNFANSLWGLMDIKVDDRIDLTQSMKNAYAYQTFFNHAFNSESNRTDYLFINELFKMDQSVSKESEESQRTYWRYDDYHDQFFDAITTITDANRDAKKQEFMDNPQHWSNVRGSNPSAGDRNLRVAQGQEVILSSKLQCPLFNTSKCLPTNMRVRISMTKNSDAFLLLANEDAKYNIVIEDIYLEVTYTQPSDAILNIIDEKLRRNPALYFISRPEIIIKPISHSNRIIRITDIFHDKIPPYAFFCLQKSSDFEGKQKSNPYAFIPFSKFQFFINGTPYFNNPLEITYHEKNGERVYGECGSYLRQLYKTIGRDLKGDSLINSTNFQLNFIVGMSFTADRCGITSPYLNLQQRASTHLEIDMGINESDIPDDMVLIIYAIHDRLIEINSERQVSVIE